jgi:Rrf2 family cysteine metabolism transcriptional repressor
MNLSQKCQYALRGVFELCKRYGQGVTRIGEIAEVQAIPPRFLEQILNQLRQSGYVESRRGIQGGYLMAVPPSQVTVGEIIRLIDGPIAPVKCVTGKAESDCPLFGKCAFMGLWERARDAMVAVYDSTSFQDLLDEEHSATTGHASYSI